MRRIGVIQMALHVIRKLYSEEDAKRMAKLTEYTWNAEPAYDPFAKP